MRGNEGLSVPSSPLLKSAPAVARSPLAGLFAPLDFLLAGGGDTRLAVDPVTRLNGYGCRPSPRPEAFTFASSTATSISGRAYASADEARERLLVSALSREEAYEEAIDKLRARLLSSLGLSRSGAAVIFAPSGTDVQLHAAFLAGAVLGGPLTSIIVASDETGSGARFALTGRHFNDKTALGVTVEKGATIAGFGPFARIDIPVCDANGRRRTPEELDEAVIAAVASEVASGRKVLLQTMDRSKLWRRAPTRAALDTIAARWTDEVVIAVDACQMRTSPARIQSALSRGEMVLVTGSKFFTGPPFSGALILPASFARRCENTADIPPGLADYSHASDWPRAWQSLRAGFPRGFNIGQWLRWEAAMAEIEAYRAVPRHFREHALAHFSASATTLIGAAGLELICDEPEDCTDPVSDGEFRVRTILPFVLRRNATPLTLEQAGTIYRALNRDVARDLPPDASAEERRLASLLCHIGQPVALRLRDGSQSAVLRISAGARIVSESWRTRDPARALEQECDQVRQIVAKIGLLLKHGIG
jgi:hypothetical protein